MTNEKLNVIIKRQTLAAAAAADDAERDVGRRSVTWDVPLSGDCVSGLWRSELGLGFSSLKTA